MSKTFRWLPVHNGRHAIPGELRAGEDGKTLCGKDFTVPTVKPSTAEWLWPTCLKCNELARYRTFATSPLLQAVRRDPQ